MNTIEGTKNSLECTLGIAALVLFECALAIAVLISLGIQPAEAQQTQQVQPTQQMQSEQPQSPQRNSTTTRKAQKAELKKLERNGYKPAADDPHHPDDIQHAEKKAYGGYPASAPSAAPDNAQ